MAVDEFSIYDELDEWATTTIAWSTLVQRDDIYDQPLRKPLRELLEIEMIKADRIRQSIFNSTKHDMLGSNTSRDLAMEYVKNILLCAKDKLS